MDDLANKIKSAGDELSVLETVRDDIAKTIDETTSGRDLALLYLRLLRACEDIRNYEASEPATDALDELAAKRSTRRKA